MPDRKLPKRDRFPSFGGLKAFYEVALTGSAVGAAQRLSITASTISHQLKSLETELGVRLVENRKGKLNLTAEGSRFFERIRRPMAEILDATNAIRSAPGRRRVTLTLTPSFAAGWLLPRLLDLNMQHPDLEINLVTTTRVVDLTRENIDLAIRRGFGQWDECMTDPLLKETIVPVIAPSLLKTLNCKSLSQALVKTRALINTTVENEWTKWCKARQIAPPDPSSSYDLETYELTVQAARDGLGIALGRRPLVDPLIASGELVSPFNLPDVDETGYYIVRSHEPMTSDTRRLHDWLKSQAS